MATNNPERKYSDEQLQSDDVTKKDLLTLLQEIASFKFLQEHKLKGSVKNVVKTKTKEQLVEDYKTLYETEAFRQEGEVDEAKKVDASLAKRTQKLSLSEETKSETPQYAKRVMKKGDGVNFARKGDHVHCFYRGKLEDGTIFDQNDVEGTGKYGRKGKKPQPLRFKVGVGNVIRGWDEALLTMSSGEKAELTIEPAWAYGKKGNPEGKIPPNARLIFEVELVAID